MSKVLHTSMGGEVNFFSNSCKLEIMGGVIAMKNIVMKRMLVSRIFHIRIILPIFRDFTLFLRSKIAF